ncbi:hypothetical protein, partial [Bacteroides clarus]|uniref:hypothetical protein n=1 Tax=Bacteroides clarus TaxID=626929 RepID=UPI0035639566
LKHTARGNAPGIIRSSYPPTPCKGKRVAYKNLALTGRNVNHIHIVPGCYPGLEDKRLSALYDSIYRLGDDIYSLKQEHVQIRQ